MNIWKKLSNSVSQREWLIPIILAAFFILITLPGIDWGIPSGWNPDELIQRVIKALQGEWTFDETNFDYPSLPKYTMFWLGKLVLTLGFGDPDVMWAARALSVSLGAGTVALSYFVARRFGASILTAGLAALFVLSNSELAQHARYAHNDIYLVFFTLLAVWASLRFVQEEKRGWFYLSAFVVGLAASSKYNGGALLILPFALFAIQRGKDLFRDYLASIESGTIALLAAFAGYALGTPRALLWMGFYFKRVIPALQGHASYSYRPGRLSGLLRQFDILPRVFGEVMFILGLAAFIYFLARAWQIQRKTDIRAASTHLLLPLSILAFDIPIMFSFNYPQRFFLPFVPLFSILIALSAEKVWLWFKQRELQAGKWGLVTGLVLLLAFSFLRASSVFLLFQNDARIAASEFLASQPEGDSVEYTFYPPSINRQQFERAHNYPLSIIKLAGEEVPEGKIYEFNTGLEGINERQTQFLVIDNFTYRRFQDDYICELNLTECAFFSALLAEETDYVLIGNFAYELPDWLPEMRISFVNPEIRIYERAPLK